MSDSSYEDRADGRLAKVIELHDDSHTVYAKLAGGGTVRFSGREPFSLSRGDVFFISEEGQLFDAPRTAWKSSASIGVVRKILDDGVLLESGVSLEILRGETEQDLQPGNTVEYTEEDGIIQIVSREPLRYRDSGVDESVNKFIVESGDEQLSFDSFGGYPEVVARAKELIETQLDRAIQLKAIGAKPVKGVIFTGQPGTGKTHLARIIAQVSMAKFYLVSGPSIVSKWVGESEDTLRQIFEHASKQERSIIFFDEIDSIAAQRGSDSNGESKRVVAQLLTLLDGFEADNIIVIAATNRVEDIDEALLRPGRFDWEIEFPLPTSSDRLAILQIRAGQLQTVDPLPLEELSVLTDGWSGAMLTAIWTEAALIAAGDGRSAISDEDMASAFERIRARPTRARSGGDS